MISRGRVCAALAPAALVLTCAAPAGAVTVQSGPLRASTAPSTFRLAIDQGGKPLLRESAATGTGGTGRLGLRLTDGRWMRATRVVSASGRSAVLATTDPGGRQLAVSLAPDGNGAIRLRARVTGGPAGGVTAVGMSFGAAGRERYLGFGEKNDGVDQRGRTVVNRVTEGPYLEKDYPVVAASVPDWAEARNRGATYFPMPWMVSTRGYGVLIDNAEDSAFRLASDRRSAWGLEADSTALSVRFIAGPTPAAAVRRLTARIGRQPAPPGTWAFGPWFQTGHQNEVPGEQNYLRLLRRADAPASVVETHMRHMPCGVDRGKEASEKRRVAAFHAKGAAVMTYNREALCQSYQPLFDQGAAQNVFTRRLDGGPYVYTAFAGTGNQQVAQIDFSNPKADAYYAGILRRSTTAGYDGWMEDYGEYTPPDSRSADGRPASQEHNLYPVFYHRSGQRFAQTQSRPIVRFTRSGWTGSARYTPIVWGGDPSTVFGFDGLQSAVSEGLSMGLSGVGVWGSDTGGFFTLTGPGLTRELLHRWIEFSSVSGVMRTKAEGVGVNQEKRPQVWQPQTRPLWRRYAKLRTQLYPYIAAAAATYRRSGLPLMRHLALAYPSDPRATARADEFLFGPDLLAAPVLRDKARTRSAYLPRGSWIDLWRSARYDVSSGGLDLGRTRSLGGGRRVTVPAPLDQLPLFVRRGALLPMLSPDVDTLAPYRGGGAVRAADRRNRMRILAFPRGSSAAAMGSGRERLASNESTGGWRLRVRGSRTRRYVLQASMRTLKSPLRPGSVRLGGRALPRRAWSYSARTGVLRATFTARSNSLTVTGR